MLLALSNGPLDPKIASVSLDVTIGPKFEFYEGRDIGGGGERKPSHSLLRLRERVW